MPPLSSPCEAHTVSDVAKGELNLSADSQERVKSFRFKTMPSVGGGVLGRGREWVKYSGNGQHLFEEKSKVLHDASISPREGKPSKTEKSMTEKVRGSTESELHGLALKILDDVDGDDAEAVEMLRISAHAGYDCFKKYLALSFSFVAFPLPCLCFASKSLSPSLSNFPSLPPSLSFPFPPFPLSPYSFPFPPILELLTKPIDDSSGYGPSCEELAGCYEKGRGVVEHQGKARHWREKARQANDRGQFPGPLSPGVGHSPISPRGDAPRNGDGKSPVGAGGVGGEADSSPAQQVSLFGFGRNGKGGEKSGGGGSVESASMQRGQLVVVGTGDEGSKGGKGWWLRQMTSWASEALAVACGKGVAGGDFESRSTTRLVEGGVKGAPEGAKILKIVRPAAEGAQRGKGKGKGLVGGWVQGIQKARWRGRRGGDAVGKLVAPLVTPRHATVGVTPRHAPVGISGGGLGGGEALGESARVGRLQI